MAEPAQARYTRCLYAVGDVLTDIMREYMMHSKIPITVIYNKIMEDSDFKRRLSQQEMSKIQTLESLGFAECDISIMCKIASYHKFAMIIPDDPSHGWKSYPLDTDNKFCDNILRIRSCRNEITHNPNTALSENELTKMFELYLDIGRRAAEHLSKNKDHFTRRIEYFITCSLDKEMEEKYKGEMEVLRRLVELNPRAGNKVRTYATKETQTQIDNIRTNELYECTSSATLTLTGITNADENIEKLNNAKDSFSTENIQLKKVKKGSLVLFLKIRNRLFEDNKLMESELDQFVKCLFSTADLQCDPNHECAMFLELEEEDTDTEETDTQDSDTEDDLVLQVEIKNCAFETEESLSQNINQFISNVVTKVNGKLHTSHNEVTAILEIVNYDSPYGQISDVQHPGHGISSIKQPVSSTSFARMNKCDTSEKIQDNMKSKTLQLVHTHAENQLRQLYATTRSLSCQTLQLVHTHAENQLRQLYATTRSLSCQDLASGYRNAQVALETEKYCASNQSEKTESSMETSNYCYRHAEQLKTDVFGVTPALKHQMFVHEPMYNKAVIGIPGIGQQYSDRLREHGFVHANQIYMKYLQMGGNHDYFVDWLARLCMPHHHPFYSRLNFENAYAALTEWHRNWAT